MRQDWVGRILAALQDLLRLNRGAEGLLVDVVASSAPWLAPVLPAYMVYGGVTGRLGFAGWAGVVAALAVEFVGFAAMSTALMLWEYNQTRRKVDPPAPVGLAAGIGVFYLAVVLVVNVVMDVLPGLTWLVRLLLSTMSAPGVATLALRAQHQRRLALIAQAKAERRERQEDAGKSPETPQVERKEAGKLPEDWRQLAESDRLRVAGMATTEIVTAFGVPERTARNWRARGRELEKVRGNGKNYAR